MFWAFERDRDVGAELAYPDGELTYLTGELAYLDGGLAYLGREVALSVARGVWPRLPELD